MIILYIFAVGTVIGIIQAVLDRLHKETTETIESIEVKETPFYIDDEIAMLESLIERNKQAAAIVEDQLLYCKNERKKVALLSRINTLDKQTYNYKRKIDKLLEKRLE